MAFTKIFSCTNFSGFAFSLIIKRGFRTTPVKKVITVKNPRIRYEMNTAYFHNHEGEDKVHVILTLCQENMSSVLKFERNISEPLEFFLKRLGSKLDAVWGKKLTRKRKHKNVELIDFPEFNPMLLINNEPISSNLMFYDVFQEDFNGDLKLRILDNDCDVVINSPIIEEIRLPKYLQVGCVAFPECITAKNMNAKNSEFTWFRSTQPNKETTWEKCGEGFYYKTKADDLCYFLKLSCIPKNSEKVGPKFEVISECQIEDQDSLVEIKKRHEFTKEKTGSDEFRVVSYNVLADMYVNTKEGKTELFIFCNPSYLDYDYRKCLLDFELLGYNADILCLQEFERKLYNHNLLLFEDLGYKCLYCEKNSTREGSALLYNKNKFSFVSATQHLLTEELLYNPLFSDIKTEIIKNGNLISRLSNIASQIQVAILECAKSNILVIGNVHFYFHPNADHIRLLQGITALRILLKTTEDVKQMHPDKKISVLLCGDFNSTPECGFHQLLLKGSVGSDHPDWQSNEDEAVTNVSFSHLLSMKSSYENVKFTNYVPTFQDCLDYIYYQTDHLELKQTVPIPSEDVLRESIGIPSMFFPSDHVALIADFKFKESC